MTLRIGSPIVFQTTPPQPASNARATISALLVIGQLASQNGFGLRMPAMSVNRSTPGHGGVGGRTGTMRGPPRPSASTIERAASLPAWTALTTSAPPLAMSPIAQTFGLPVRPVAGSADRDAVADGDAERRQQAAGHAGRPVLADGPDDGVQRRPRTASPRPATGRRRPDASGSPSVIASKTTLAHVAAAAVDLDGRREPADGDAQRAREVDRVRVGGALDRAPAVEEGDLLGAEADGRGRGVERRAAAADHADAPADERVARRARRSPAR